MSDKLCSWEDAVLWMRRQQEFKFLVDACFYDDPLPEAAERYFNSSEWKAVKAFYPHKIGKALDLGAGRGIASYALASDGWDVTALEPDPSSIVGAGAIKYLATFAKMNIHVEESWGETLPFSDETFDMVHARQVLHHARDLNQLCCEASRVLKKGGVFLATREHVISKLADLPHFLEAHPLHNLYGGENAYLLAQYIDAISMSGIQLTSVLNPYQSDINLYPDTLTQLRARVAKHYHLPSCCIPNWLLALRGGMMDVPGRLYTFVGYKK